MYKHTKDRVIYFCKGILMSGIISVIISIIGSFLFNGHLTVTSLLINSFKLFLSLLPIVFLTQRNFLFKDGPLKSTALILYYLILLPCINLSLNIHEDEHFKIIFILINIINITLIIVSHFLLLKYVFSDFFSKKRAVVPSDIIVIFTTYITIAISFGLIYTIISLYSSEPAFSNISFQEGLLDYYFKHIYFSFITIATVGYGDIVPLNTAARFLSIIEVIFGMLLTNVILGLVIGSGIFTFKTNKK
ncbi:potassium channel family protein [Fusobacterium sp.]|uniref:potassium channel family protein n=1 Tax=Fusobacterium sp. TaxID=68766 RepID=UPI00396C6339